MYRALPEQRSRTTFHSKEHDTVLAATGQLRYKPAALRIPILLSFLAVFATCVGMIEWTLSDTTRFTTSTSPTRSLTSTTTLHKRSLTTYTTWLDLDCDEFYTLPCAGHNYATDLATLISGYSRFCNGFSSTFLPYSKSMPPFLSTELMTWNSQAKEKQIKIESMFKTSRICSNPAAACSAKWALATADIDAKIPYLTFVGCSSSIVDMGYGCWTSGLYTLINGTSLTTTKSAACGAPMASQMVITTEIGDDDDMDAAVTLPTYVLSTATRTSAVPTSAANITTNTDMPSASFSPSIVPPTASQTPDFVAQSTRSSTAQGPAISDHGSSSNTRSTVPRPLALSSASEFYEPQTTSLIVNSTFLATILSTSRAHNTTMSAELFNRTNSSLVKTATSRLLFSNSSTISNASTGINMTDISRYNATMNTNISTPSMSSVTKVASNKTTSASSAPQSTFHLSSSEVMKKSTFTATSYFYALYLPPIMAVFIKSFWEVIAASLKMIEPFERLANPIGSTAKYSMLAQYLSSIVSLDAIRALGHRRLLPIWTAIMYAMLETVAPVATASMTCKPKSYCHVNGILRPCNPAWIIKLPMIRVVEGILIFCMVLLLLVIWSTRKSRIAVASNPSSISSLAALLNHEPLLRLLQEIDPDADEAAFSAALEGYLFRLDEHDDPDEGQPRFGIVSTRSAKQVDHSVLDMNWLPTSIKEPTISYMPIEGQHPATSQRSKRNIISNTRLQEQIQAYLHLITTSALFALILGYYLDNNTDGFNAFLNSDGIVPKTLLVGLATIVDIQMKHLERVVRVSEPFRRMSLRNARAETTILVPLNGTCWSNLPRCLYLLARYEFSQGRMWWQCVVSIVAALSDFNIIAVAGVLWNEGQTTTAYNISVFGSVALTGCILITGLVALFWWMRVRVFRQMPRQPDTIGTMFSYLCASEFVKNWVSNPDMRMELLDSSGRDAVIKRMNRRFWFGRTIGTDEKERWCIDYDGGHCEVDRTVHMQMGDARETTPIRRPRPGAVPRRKPVPQRVS